MYYYTKLTKFTAAPVAIPEKQQDNVELLVNPPEY